MTQLLALHRIEVENNLSNTRQWRCPVEVLLCFRSVKMYSTYSPCANCADVIIDFTSRRQCQLSVSFSCLFRHKEDRHRDGLRRLNSTPRVVVGVFTSTLFHVYSTYTYINGYQPMGRERLGGGGCGLSGDYSKGCAKYTSRLAYLLLGFKALCVN